MPNICLICPRYAQDMPKISPRYVQDMRNICPKYAKNMPKLCPRYVQDTNIVLLPEKTHPKAQKTEVASNIFSSASAGVGFRGEILK